jgi:hypothetical protein
VKNKKMMQYLVMLATAGIWGVVGYRIYTAYHASDPRPDNEDHFIVSADSTSLPDTFSIMANYRDPFLDKMQAEKPPLKTNPVKTTTPLPVVKKTELTWPPITYEGMIRNEQSKKLLAIVHINGQGMMLKPGEAFSEIILSKVFKDSIELVMGKEKKIVRK